MSFNLKKRSQVPNVNDQASFDSYLQMLITQLNQTGAMPTEEALAEITDMKSLSLYGIDGFTSLKNMIEQQQDLIKQQEDMQNNMVAPVQEPGTPVTLMPTMAKGNNKMQKPFNLKKAQFENSMSPPPAMPQGIGVDLNDSPEIMGDQLEMQQDVGTRKFKDGADVGQWLQNEVDLGAALSFTTQNDTSENADLVKEMIEQYYDMLGDPSSNLRDLEIIAGQIFDYFPENVKEGGEILAIEKEFNVINKTLQKIAQNTIGKNKKKSFNIKTAQHKSLDNAILWGPGQTRIDPFLHQPVSDWHIVERNKGFGLVVDDVWNIDYETIWRENIMDKYSRPYRDKEGNYVGGYIQKRFEVDKNIPDTNNYQLKPGEIRRPVLPEYGNTESRLQAARAAGDIVGANDTSKPFNWKEASKKITLKKAYQDTGFNYQQQSSPEYYNRIVQQATDFANKMGIDGATALESFIEGNKIDVQTQKWLIQQVNEGIMPRGNMQVPASTMASAKKKS